MVHDVEVWQVGGDAHMFDGTPCSSRVESSGWPPVPDVDRLQAALERDEAMRDGVHADRIDPEHVDNLRRSLPDGRPVNHQTDKPPSEAWLDQKALNEITRHLAEQNPNGALDAGFFYEAVANAKFWKSANGVPLTLAEVGRLVIDRLKGGGLSDDFVRPLLDLVESLEGEARYALATVHATKTIKRTNQQRQGTLL